jgi:competence protein ComEA
MGKTEKQIILFFTVAIASGLLFLSLNRFRIYQNYVKISDKSKTKINSSIKNSPIVPDNKERTIENTQKIDINSADLNMLITLPGIGRETALNIIDYRSKSGGFKDTEELLSVKGIGIKKLESIRKLIIIEQNY